MDRLLIAIVDYLLFMYLFHSDAGVNGGIDMYKNAFFQPDFLKENSSKKDAVIKLKEALNEQLEILDKGTVT